MDIFDALKARHSVRAYEDKPIGRDIVEELEREISVCNDEGGLNIQLVTNEPDAFGKSLLARYGKFKNVNNYIVLAGRNADGLEEKAGYYGEHIVLKAQMLGLNTCWVGGTFSKGKSKKHFMLLSDEKFVCVISLGYGVTQGVLHKSKPVDTVCDMPAGAPEWYKAGIDAAMLAPTAMNQQKFYFSLDGNKVKAETKRGFFAKLDLGIAKYHFELGADRKNFEWAE